MSGTTKMTLGDLLRQKRIDYGYEDLDAMARDLMMEPWHLHRLLTAKKPRLSTETKYRICLKLDIAPRVLEEVVGK